MEIARLNLVTAIKQAIHCRSGKDFEATVQGILSHCLDGYQAVVPYGRDGDGGNDGYSRSEGLYTQIYAPTSSRSSLRDAARKAQRDFAKLKRTWSSVTPIKQYWFITNSIGSNIHLETALSQIARKHNVETRFVGSAELANEAMKINRAHLEALMGFAIETDNEESKGATTDLDILSSVAPQYLDALHLLAALDYPFVHELCEELLPQAVNWKTFWKWLEESKWITYHNGHFQLDEKIVATFQKNRAAQKRACEIWVPVLLNQGSVDCIYLAITLLVKLLRVKEALRLVSYAGTSLVGFGWDTAMLHIWEVFNKPRLLRRLTGSERLAFALAGANLYACIGKNDDAFKLFRNAFQRKAKWPRTINRGLMTLNFGVSAHRSGKDRLAAQLYNDAMGLSRKNGDDLVLGRAATNLAQAFIPSDNQKAVSLLYEGEAAKKRANDVSGLVTVAMIRGLIAAENNQPMEACRLFERAKALLLKIDDQNILADLSFNLGKSYGEADRWADAVREYRVSLREAEMRKDVYKQLRARSGLAGAYFKLRRWSACQKECEVLAALPESTTFPIFRLTGMHGLIVLKVRNGKKDHLGEIVSRALQFARHVNEEDWIGRILVDATFANPRHEPSASELYALLAVGKSEQKARRHQTALAIYRTVWAHSVQMNEALSDIEESAKSLLDALIIRIKDATQVIAQLKWQYSVLMDKGDPLRAARCLEIAAALARKSRLWTECACVLDECAVIFAELERPDLSLPLHREALRLAKKYHVRDQERISAANLAECLRRLGNSRDALEVSKSALALHDATAAPEQFISTLHNHHLIQLALQQHISASQTLRRCEIIARQHSIYSEEIRALMARGMIAWDNGALGKAETFFRRALKEAKRRKISHVAADCHYNLALLLRKKGRVSEALRLLESPAGPNLKPPHSLHQMLLKALLLEDSNRLKNAKHAWNEAARIAEGIDDYMQMTYCRTRARLITTSPNVPPASRAKLADEAHMLIASIYELSACGTAMQQCFDSAQLFFAKHDLPFYQIRAYHALADRLTQYGGVKNLNNAAEASVASVIMAANDASQVSVAMREHVRWLLSLDVSQRRIAQLKTVAQRWLRKTFKKTSTMETLDIFLQGFEMVEKEFKRKSRVLAEE